MFRHLQIESDTLVYNGSNKATATFTRKTNKKALIIGKQLKCSNEKFAAQNLISSFKIASRQLIQGDAFPVGLIADTIAPPAGIPDSSKGTAATAVPAVDTASEAGTPDPSGTLADVTAAFSQTVLNNNFATLNQTLIAIRNGLATLAALATREPAQQVNGYFPGSAVALSNGQRVGAIPVNPDETITIELEDLTAGSAEIESVILHLVEIPDECEDNAEATHARAIWQQVDKGIGSLTFFGRTKAYTTSLNTKLTMQPVPTAEALRQVEVRGSAVVTTGAEPAESDFADLSVALSTGSEESAQGEPISARATIGTVAKPRIGSARVDLIKDESAIIQLSAPAPTAGRTLYFASILEGRGQQRKQVHTAKAAS
ncbi:MAG: hypothetical protein V3V10_02220 [Planctomycetota bacterium]